MVKSGRFTALLVLGGYETDTGEELYQNLRKIYRAGRGLPFANARIAVEFVTLHKLIYTLFTMA